MAGSVCFAIPNQPLILEKKDSSETDVAVVARLCTPAILVVTVSGPRTSACRPMASTPSRMSSPCSNVKPWPTWVANAYYYKQPYEPVTVHLHDRGDELTKLRRTFWAEENSERYRWYPLDLVPLGRIKRQIMRFAVGMAGMTTNCQLGAPSRCQIPATDTKAQNLYCPTFGVRDLHCQPVLDRLKPRG